MFETIKEFWYKSRLRAAEQEVRHNSGERKALQAKHLRAVAKYDKLKAIVRAY